MNIQSACLFIYPITVDSFASLFNCSPVDRSCIRLNDGANIMLVDLLKLVGLDYVFSVAQLFGVQLVVFFCAGIYVVLFYTIGVVSV